MFNKNNLWKICPESTKMFNFDHKIKEKINTENLDLILKSGFNKTYTCSEWLEQFHCPFNDVQKHLLKIKKNIRNGFVVSKAQVVKFGRATFKGHISMALLPNEIRQALSIGITKDYDIENCQPQLLYQLCKKMKIPKKEYKEIKNYCKNRDDFIKSLRKTYKKKFETFKDAKRFYKVMIIATAFFGGSIKKHKSDNGIDEEYTSKKLMSLKMEVNAIITNYIMKNNAQIYANITSEIDKQYEKEMKLFKNGKITIKPYKKKPEARLSSLFLQNWERIIIETVISRLTEENKMVKNRFIYTYDGFQENGDFSCEDLDKIVKEECAGIECKFVIKGTEEGEEFIKKCKELVAEDMLDKEHPEKSLKEFDISYFEDLKYDFCMMVDYWEKFFCFTVEDGNYWFSDTRTLKDPETGRIKRNRTTKPYKWSALKESFGHYTVMIKEEKIVKGDLVIQNKEVTFIEEWQKQGMRSYKQMDFFPENLPLKQRLNAQYFNVFAGYPEFVFGESTFKEGKYKRIWEGLLMNLLGDKKAMKHFNNIVSYKIKYPARKKPFGVIIKGKQGEGKNFILSRIAKVIGESHYLTTSNVKDVIGDYAMGLFHKLIVNLNEMDLTSTKSLTNRFKSIVSENEITFNPKHSNQFEAINYALMIITTNEMIPIVLDVMTGERRWFIFEGNGCNCTINQDKWSKIYKMTDTDEFTKFLYDYYNDMDCESFDFKKAKRENAKTEAYNNVASLFIPYEMLFLKDWILDKSFDPSCLLVEDSDEEYDELGYKIGKKNNPKYIKPKKKTYYELETFYKPYTIEIKKLLYKFWEWSQENRISLGEKKNEKSFKGKLMSFNFKNMTTHKDSTSRRASIQFRPCDILRQLIEKSAYDDDMEKWNDPLLNKQGTLKKEENLNFLEDL